MKMGAGASSQSWHRCVELMAQRFARRSALLCHMTLLVQDHSIAAGKQTHSEQFSAGCCSVPKLPDPCPYPRHSGNGKGAWPGTQCPSSLCPQLSTFFLMGRGLALPYHKPYAKQWCHTDHKLFCSPPPRTYISLPPQFWFSIALPRLHYTLPYCRLDPTPLCAPKCLPTRTCLDTGF